MTHSSTDPLLVFAGLGIHASPPWEYARIAAKLGQIGVVSGAGFEYIFTRILQRGDLNGHYRKAIKSFPDQEMAKRVFNRYYRAGGISPTKRYIHIEQPSLFPSRDLIELIIVANYCQVWIAKNGHDGLIGVNFLEKIQIPLIHAIYGVLLAGVDYLFIGAGIPNQISKILKKLIRHEPATYQIKVEGMDEKFPLKFYPREIMDCKLTKLNRPKFGPIIALSSLAKGMTRNNPDHGVDLFVAENYIAGGHSMNPRVKGLFTPDNQPIYGTKDDPNFDQLRKIRIPFYVAGAYASPEKLDEALALGALGIQVGSIGADSEGSGVQPHLSAYIRKHAYRGDLVVDCSLKVSPTKFSFKVVKMPGTLGDPDVYATRNRICDIGALLVPYFKGGKGKNKYGYRCSAEPIESYCKKGGNREDTDCKACLCNGLFSTVDLGQRLPNGTIEPPILTHGLDYSFIQHLIHHENGNYSIEDVAKYLLSKYPDAIKYL